MKFPALAAVLLLLASPARADDLAKAQRLAAGIERDAAKLVATLGQLEDSSTSPLVDTRPVITISAPVRLTESYSTIRPCVLVKAQGYVGAGLVIENQQGKRIRDIVADHVKVIGHAGDGSPGIVIRNVASSTFTDLRAERCDGPGIVVDSAWNVDLTGCQSMYCGAVDGVGVEFSSEFALSLDEGRGSVFWRQGLNDVRWIGGRSEGGKVQLRIRDTTDVVVIGTKLHGDPQGRDDAGPLAEVVSPRGPHLFSGLTTAHGVAPLIDVRGGEKQTSINVATCPDSDWPLNRPREIVRAVDLPPGSVVKVDGEVIE